MQRVAIVGSGGAGKTTLANRLGEVLGLPVVHLDEHYWQPGWIAAAQEEWRDRQRCLIAGDCWIADGNYSSTLDLRLTRADTVIILAYSRWRCLRGVGRRWAHHRGRAIQAKGCPERVDLAYLRWVWNYPTAGRARLREAIARHANHHVCVVELHNPREVSDFLREKRSTCSKTPASG